MPWLKNEIKDPIRTRRRAERKWRKYKSVQDLGVFKMKKNHATFLMNQACCEYYTSHIRNNSLDQRKLFKVTKTLLREPKTASFPHGNPDQLANDFGNFFVQKIEKINKSLADLSTPSPQPSNCTTHAEMSILSPPASDFSACAEVNMPPPSVNGYSSCVAGLFTGFRSLSQEQVSELIGRAAGKSCQLDPMPSPTVLHLLDVCIPPVHG